MSVRPKRQAAIAAKVVKKDVRKKTMKKKKVEAKPKEKEHKFAAVGILADAQDAKGRWGEARVIDVDQDSKKLKVHFQGWHKRFDVWVELAALSPHGTKVAHAVKCDKSLKKGQLNEKFLLSINPKFVEKNDGAKEDTKEIIASQETSELPAEQEAKKKQSSKRQRITDENPKVTRQVKKESRETKAPSKTNDQVNKENAKAKVPSKPLSPTKTISVDKKPESKVMPDPLVQPQRPMPPVQTSSNQAESIALEQCNQDVTLPQVESAPFLNMPNPSPNSTTIPIAQAHNDDTPNVIIPSTIPIPQEMLVPAVHTPPFPTLINCPSHYATPPATVRHVQQGPVPSNAKSVLADIFRQRVQMQIAELVEKTKEKAARKQQKAASRAPKRPRHDEVPQFSPPPSIPYPRPPPTALHRMQANATFLQESIDAWKAQQADVMKDITSVVNL